MVRDGFLVDAGASRSAAQIVTSAGEDLAHVANQLQSAGEDLASTAANLPFTQAALNFFMTEQGGTVGQAALSISDVADTSLKSVTVMEQSDDDVSRLFRS